ERLGLQVHAGGVLVGTPDNVTAPGGAVSLGELVAGDAGATHAVDVVGAGLTIGLAAGVAHGAGGLVVDITNTGAAIEAAAVVAETALVAVLADVEAASNRAVASQIHAAGLAATLGAACTGA